MPIRGIYCNAGLHKNYLKTKVFIQKKRVLFQKFKEAFKLLFSHISTTHVRCGVQIQKRNIKTNCRFYKTSVYISAYNWTTESTQELNIFTRLIGLQQTKDSNNVFPQAFLSSMFSTSVFKFFSEMCPQYINKIYKKPCQNNAVTRHSSLKPFQTLRTKALSQKCLLYL